MKSLRVATCQFSVEADITWNFKAVLRLMTRAADQGAEVVHFSECALSGYAGVDIAGISDLDWNLLRSATHRIMERAAELNVWVVLGSTHRLSRPHRPHNSLYLISPEGKLVDRYDKRFCTGQSGRRRTLDLCHYSPGNRCVTFDVNGVRCGLLICYDYRFPELYREYLRLGTQVILQSFHNARRTVVDDHSYNIWRTIVPATMSCRAAENHFWISANNSSTRPSCWGSFAVRPDGAITRQLPRHRSGLLVTDMQLDPAIYDAPGPWRDAAIDGVLHSGRLIEDQRSVDVTSL